LKTMSMKRSLTAVLLIGLGSIGYPASGQNPAPGSPAATTRSASAIPISYLVAALYKPKPGGFSLMPASRRVNLNGPVVSIIPTATVAGTVAGSGTTGRLTKWTGFGGGNSLIGDSSIFESKTGLVGVGTDTPTSKLTVAGTIQSTSGGFRFPDGSVQTTSASAVPLVLIGSAPEVIHATNTEAFGDGIVGRGGAGGFGVFGSGGDSSTENGGVGVRATGGDSSSNEGGQGLSAAGGDSNSGSGGAGVNAVGGNSDSAAGDGVHATGGNSPQSPGVGVNAVGGFCFDDTGGTGIAAAGGTGNGAGHNGGIGIIASGGPGLNGATVGLAGKFNGNVEITGNLNVSGTKNFRIDHPLDPANKYLYHAAIESSEVLNVYSGNVTTGANGEAVVTLPDWFEAINKDLRYQLTVIGQFAQAIVGSKIRWNRFIIKTNAPNVEVSWQVTGVRSDPNTVRNGFKVEEHKPERERSAFLNSAANSQPEEKRNRH
jgi:hypothetical protein